MLTVRYLNGLESKKVNAFVSVFARIDFSRLHLRARKSLVTADFFSFLLRSYQFVFSSRPAWPSPPPPTAFIFPLGVIREPIVSQILFDCSLVFWTAMICRDPVVVTATWRRACGHVSLPQSRVE
eukprot:TRINITY_DN28021_c0_g1_i1.p2 TRINITY_DN28021_c0_g1~~TRINITY_DN28021_c0_g1_i1.p2  ORF type:complete len:135 (-),score=7.40 TRINITY_DN28021_c0_g1_i1:103-477(-)